MVLNRGYTYHLGVRSTKTKGTKHQIVSGIHAPKIKKCVFNCCECSKLYQRPSLESPSVRSFFVMKLGINTMFFFTQKWGGYPVFECLLVFELYKEIEQFLRHRGSGIAGHFEKRNLLCPWHTFQIYSATRTTWTPPFGNNAVMITARESISACTNKLSICISCTKFPREKYPYSLSLKYKSICKCYGSPSKDTFIQERFLIHWVECSMQDPVIFHLKSTVWMKMMAWRKIKLKWKPVEKLK